MSRRKKIKRTLYTTGNNYFDFEINREQNIYDYLCYKDQRKKLLKDLDENNQFYYYWEWEQYIKNKYDMYDDIKLNEFSKYLNQWIRCQEPGNEYSKLFYPILISLGVTYIVQFAIYVLGLNIEQDVSIVLYMVFFLVIMIGVLLFFVIIIKATFNPFVENSNQYYMLKDYKDIIDNMIKKRKRKRKKKKEK